MSEINKVYFKPDTKLDDGDVFSGHSKRVALGDEGNDYYNYESSDIHICVLGDGALSLSNCRDDGHVYLYPDQLEHLQKALEIAIQQRSAAAPERESSEKGER